MIMYKSIIFRFKLIKSSTSTNPEFACFIFKNATDIIIAQAVGIIWIMRISLKIISLIIKSMQSPVFSSNPDFAIFARMNTYHRIIDETGLISVYIFIMNKFFISVPIRFRNEIIQPALPDTNPELLLHGHDHHSGTVGAPAYGDGRGHGKTAGQTPDLRGRSKGGRPGTGLN